jgi:hypothetical protein
VGGGVDAIASRASALAQQIEQRRLNARVLQQDKIVQNVRSSKDGQTLVNQFCELRKSRAFSVV